jgi:exopolysaccharide/PEP-CTERM locus tyrosine autokinase
LSLIENSLDRLRRAALAAKEPGVAAAAVPTAARVEPIASLEPRAVHRRFVIDLNRLRTEGYLPEEGQERRFADYCHRIKRPLVDRARSAGAEQDARLILLTSALPGDGKTFITVNLALSMARERDVSVLLVDGDLARAHLSHVLGMDGEPGLLNALRDDALDIESVVQDSDIPGLEILPAGVPSEGAAELIASVRMRELVSRLLCRNPRRLVLFDSPPLLVSSEARALVQIPGQIILVTRAGHTPIQSIIDAISQVEKKKLLGLVLNDAHGTTEGGYYYYDSAHGTPGQSSAG